MRAFYSSHRWTQFVRHDSKLDIRFGQIQIAYNLNTRLRLVTPTGNPILVCVQSARHFALQSLFGRDGADERRITAGVGCDDFRGELSRLIHNTILIARRRDDIASIHEKTTGLL
jgi:hypothetical protein